MSSPETCGRCRLMSLALAILTGALFGLGLIVSGMTQPARVIAFLDVLGHWDPTLAFVMVGAIAVYAVAYRTILKQRTEPWFELRFHLPTRRDIDIQLVLGAALFGIGWGLGGLCPGPAIVSAAAGATGALVFVVSMAAGLSIRR